VKLADERGEVSVVTLQSPLGRECDSVLQGQWIAL
jgi:hypothetical protein